MTDLSEIKQDVPHHPVPHYYGDIVRRAFLIVSILLLVTIPFYNILPFNDGVTIIFIIFLALSAALTSPLQRWVCIFDVSLSALGLILFEYYAIIDYSQEHIPEFLIRESVALLFLFALYFSAKTLRARMLD